MRTHLLKLLLLAGALFLQPPPLAAQMGTSRPSFSAPEAASLGRFGEVPVSLYTGAPNISIPLFSVKGRTLELPVSLRYQSGGIRLDDIGSWAGMGWALEAGGVITRSVRGIPDDSEHGYWFTGNVLYNDANWPYPPAGIPQSTFFQNIQTGNIDGEPDQFYFNFAGQSGQFVIGPTSTSSTLKEVRAIPYRDIKIEPVSNFTSWVVTTEDGTRYTFAAADSTYDFSGTSSSGNTGYVFIPRPRFISAWHLTEIRSPAGDVIRLHYTRYTARHQTTMGGGRNNPLSGDCSALAASFTQLNEQEFYVNRLDSITSAAHTLRFIPDAVLRADALSPTGARQEPRLAQIEVRTPSGTVIRRFELDHDYFGGNRLRLKNVFETDASGNRLAPWTFEYDPQSFPARGSFAQDDAGYWNGKANSALYPAADGSYSTTTGTSTVHLAGADRTLDPAFMRVGTLTRIIYPTGGSTSFTWETHDYGWTRFSQTTYDEPGPEQTANANSASPAPTRVDTTAFTVSGTVPATVSFDVTLNCALGTVTCPTARVVGTGFDTTYTVAGVRTRTLASGTYLLIATTAASGSVSTVGITARWKNLVHVIGRKPAPGLRIAEVRTLDGHGGQEVHKYSYRTQADSAKSSGVMEYEPIYLEHVRTGDAAVFCEYFAQSASSVTPLGASGSVAYREVTVSHGENGELGRTRTTFRNAIDNPDFGPQVPRPNLRINSYDWRRGQQLSATETNASNQVQQRTASRYSFQASEPTTYRSFRGISLSRFSFTENFYDANAFQVFSEWYYPSSDTTYSYDETGASVVTSTRTYTYGNPAHAQVTQLDETNSDGTRRITRMRYPADYESGVLTDDPDGLGDGMGEAHALTMMRDSVHMHSPVIERWVSEVVGGTERVLQGELTTYLAFPTSMGWSYLPSQRFALAAPGPVTDFAPSLVVAAAFNWDSRYLIAEQINGYDSYGRAREVIDANDGASTITYGGNPNNAFLTQIDRVGPNGGTPLATMLTYDASGNLASIRDEGGSLRTYAYDGFGRLKQIRNNAGVLVKGIGYTYSRTAANGWTYQSTAPNAVIDTTYLQQTPTVAAVVSTGFLDGLGRPIQTVTQDGSNYHVSAREYDASGRAWRIWKPYTRTTAGFDAGFVANATAFHNTDLGVSNAQPHADSLFTPDALRRPRSVIPAYVGSSTAVTAFVYGIDTPTGRRYSETTDEAGKTTRVYQDGFGNIVRTVRGYGAPEASTTQVAYNALGQTTQLTDPRGIVTGYTRDTRGQLTTRTNPDAGNRSQKFGRAGNVRFWQDANQAAAGLVGFTSYDFSGRPLVSGQGTATFAALDPRDNPPSLETNNVNWLTVRQYDAKPSTSVFPWSLFAAQFGSLTLSNTGSRLAAVASKSNGAWQAEFYSYDADGSLVKRYTFTQANGGGSVLASLNTTVDYTRNLAGSVSQRSLTVGTASFNQWYDYDGRGLLARLYASTSATRPATADAAYTYRPGGGVQLRQYQGGPVVPFRYTIREQLEGIGDPASTAYPFSARYSYHPNGRLQEAEFYNAGSPTTNKRYGYVFGATSWDALNRLRSADFSDWTGSGWTTTLANDLTGIAYDAAGNLTALGRYQQAGTVVDNLGYGYGSTSNRLSSVSDAAGVSAETWDAETGSFTYDANGNLGTAPAPYSITGATYDPQNLPLSITAAGATSTYRYNAEGQRITRQVGAGNTDAYIKEGPATLGVITLGSGGIPVSWHFNLLADQQVIGRQPSTGNRRYYHRDMLGSTRAVVEGATVVESYDYDPWGVPIPGRTLAGPTREGFTGKEVDPATGLTYYGSRYYMAALGRWTTVDPPADDAPGWSPYNYVEGNPLSNADPLGMNACPVNAGGDGKTDEYTDCPEGTLGYYANQEAQGNGGIVNSLKGWTASCAMQTSCKVVALFGAVYTSVLAADAAWTWGAARLAPAAAGAAGAAGAASRSGSVWNLNPFERGNEIEQELGQNLPRAFPTIDRFSNGIATSIKSMDLSLPSYQTTGRVLSRLSSYVRSLSSFQGASFDRATVNGADITQRVLQVAIPAGGMTPAQAQAFQQAAQAAAASANPVRIVTTVIR